MNELLRAKLDFGVKIRLIFAGFLFGAYFSERFEVGGRWEL